MKQFFPLLVALIFVMASCSPYLNKTGNYKIETITGDTATFYNLKGVYLLPGKGLYPDTTILIKSTAVFKKANVFLIKP